MINESTRTYDRSAMVTELTLSATIDNAYWAGTDDDIPRFFGWAGVQLSELDHVAVYQQPKDHPLASDDRELASLQLTAHVNDASGHYQPDGGACLRYVAEKFQALGIDTSETLWYWKLPQT